MMLVPLKDSQLFKKKFLSKTSKRTRLSGSNFKATINLAHFEFGISFVQL